MEMNFKKLWKKVKLTCWHYVILPLNNMKCCALFRVKVQTFKRLSPQTYFHKDTIQNLNENKYT